MNKLLEGRNSIGDQYGLTLLEVLIVFAILSILGVMATPVFHGYKLKAKVGAGIVTMAPVKSLVTEYYMLNDNWPMSNKEAGARAPESYSGNNVVSVTITDTPVPGAIVLHYDYTTLRMLGNNNTLIYYPVTNDSVITWKCDAGTVDAKYLPSNC